MLERRKDLLTRSLADGMIDDMRTGIHVTSDEERAFCPNLPPAIKFVDLPYPEFLQVARKIALFRLNASLKQD
jgi:hypothetical protein